MSYLGNAVDAVVSPERPKQTRKPSKKLFRIESGGVVVEETTGSTIAVPRATQNTLVSMARTPGTPPRQLAGLGSGTTPKPTDASAAGGDPLAGLITAAARRRTSDEPPRDNDEAEAPIVSLPGDEDTATASSTPSTAPTSYADAAGRNSSRQEKPDKPAADTDTATAADGRQQNAPVAAAGTMSTSQFEETNAIEEEEEEADAVGGAESAELQGWLELRTGAGGFFSRRKWVSKHFRLEGHALVCSTKEDGEPEERIEITQNLAAECEGPSVKIMTSRRSYSIRAKSAKDAKTWVTALRDQRTRVKQYRNRRLTELLVAKEDGSLGISMGGGVDSGHPDKTQIFVTEIKPGGPAEKQGLFQKGDIIVEIDGQSLEGTTLVEAVSVMQQANQSINVKVLRRKGSKRNSSAQLAPATSEVSPGAETEAPLQPVAVESTAAETASAEPTEAAVPGAAASEAPATTEAPTTTDAPAARISVTEAPTNADTADGESATPAGADAGADAGEGAPQQTDAEAAKQQEAAREERLRRMRENRRSKRQSQQDEILKALSVIDSLPED